MAAMVGCNKDATEVVEVSADAPSVNGTWVSCDDDRYSLEISGNKITAYYPSATYAYDTTKSVWVETETTAKQVFENGKISTDAMYGSVMSFVFDYTSTLYAYNTANSKELKQSVTGTFSDTFYYDKVNGYLVIEADNGYTRKNEYDDDDYIYSDLASGNAIILDGVYEKE